MAVPDDGAFFVTSRDGTKLECALYRATVAPTSIMRKRLAVVAHPYGRLGGTMHDHVVQSIAAELADAGVSVVAFNARGVGQSTGRGSLSSVLVPYVRPVCLTAVYSSIPESEDCQAVVEHALSEYAAKGPVDMLICGYSAGSLAASLARAPDEERIRVRHILVSYPASLLWALTLWRTGPFTSAIDTVKTPTLIVHGTTDQFTSLASYQAWTAKLQPNYSISMVDGADHFWHGRTRELRHAIRSWLGSLPE